MWWKRWRKTRHWCRLLVSIHTLHGEGVGRGQGKRKRRARQKRTCHTNGKLLILINANPMAKTRHRPPGAETPVSPATASRSAGTVTSPSTTAQTLKVPKMNGKRPAADILGTGKMIEKEKANRESPTARFCTCTKKEKKNECDWEKCLVLTRCIFIVCRKATTKFSQGHDSEWAEDRFVAAWQGCLGASSLLIWKVRVVRYLVLASHTG